MKQFCTADTHFGHGRIIEYANRPFTSSQQMNERLIANWNQRVTNEDLVYIVGDFCFKSGIACEKADYWKQRLNGEKIFIKGNHDNNNSTKTDIESLNLFFSNQRIHLTHKPEHANTDYELNIVGHVHQHWHIIYFRDYYRRIESLMESQKDIRNEESLKLFLNKHTNVSQCKTILFNCGVDVNKYMPITVNEILDKVRIFKKG